MYHWFLSFISRQPLELQQQMFYNINTANTTLLSSYTPRTISPHLLLAQLLIKLTTFIEFVQNILNYASTWWPPKSMSSFFKNKNLRKADKTPSKVQKEQDNIYAVVVRCVSYVMISSLKSFSNGLINHYGLNYTISTFLIQRLKKTHFDPDLIKESLKVPKAKILDQPHACVKILNGNCLYWVIRHQSWKKCIVTNVTKQMKQSAKQKPTAVKDNFRTTCQTLMVQTCWK